MKFKEIVRCISLIIKFMKVLKLQWWIYCVIAIILFLLCLLLNFIVKKINETKRKKRSNRLEEKALSNELNQVDSTSFFKGENKTFLKKNVEDSKVNISLVFDRDKNISRKADTENLDEIPFTQDTVTISKAYFKNMEAANLEALPRNNALDNNIRDNIHDIKHEDDIKVLIDEDCKEVLNNSSHKLNISNDLTNNILDDIDEKFLIKINEPKSTPPMKRLIDVQNEEELQDCASDIAKRHTECCRGKIRAPETS